MDWHNLNFDWNRARAFHATAQEGSFSAAARALGVTQPTIGRQIAALEEELGVTLVERVGTGLRLTSAGVDLAEQVKLMADAAARATLIAAGQATSLEGVVRIAASETIAAHLLPPVLAKLRGEHPGITYEIVASNDASDLRRREADVAIRNFRPRDDALVATKVKDSAAHFYAAPSYVERAGPFDTADDLARAEIFGFEPGEVMTKMFAPFGIPVTAENFTLVTANHLVQWQMAKAGLGICMMMEAVGEAEPGVVRVFEALPSIPVPIWVVSHRELKTSRRIRVVFDAVVAGLRTAT